MPRAIGTVDDVCWLLIELFRGRGAYAATPGQVEAQVNWRRRFLVRDDEAWRALMLRAQCGAEGSSVRERLRERGWSGSRFERAWRRGAVAIVAGIAGEGLNNAALDANLDAEARLEDRGLLPWPADAGMLPARLETQVTTKHRKLKPALDFDKIGKGSGLVCNSETSILPCPEKRPETSRSPRSRASRLSRPATRTGRPSSASRSSRG